MSTNLKVLELLEKQRGLMPAERQKMVKLDINPNGYVRLRVAKSSHRVLFDIEEGSKLSIWYRESTSSGWDDIGTVPKRANESTTRNAFTMAIKELVQRKALKFPAPKSATKKAA